MVRGSYDYHKILLLDVSNKFDFPPIVSQVRCMGYRYIMENNLYIPTLSLDVNFARLEEMTEYSGLNALANVDLADYITVEYPTIGLYTKAQIVKTTMDVLNDRYESMTVGDQILNIADTIARLEREIG
jgi:phage-related protein